MKVAVTIPYFDFFPHLKSELQAIYPDAKFRSERHRLSEDEFIEYVRGYDAAVIGIENFSERVFASLPELKIVSLCSAGVDHIDPALLNKYGVKMWWAAGVNKVSVAELSIASMIFAIRKVHYFSSILRRGEWKGPVGFGNDLRGKTVGIHGCGHIGKEVVKLLQPFGVKIIVCDRAPMDDFLKQHNAEAVSADELWARSDVLTIHLSKNSSTIGMYTADVLDKMKPGAFLVNLARGFLVDEKALRERLDSGRIAGAVFDVFAVEPANGNPLIDHPNMFAFPHIGATTRESWENMLRSGMYGVEKAYDPKPGVYPFD
ncbi:MAG: NAD(P)-dependent oxidoreductase [Beijerinckiaceae bacterium]